MNLLRNIRLALRTLSRNRLRSFFMMLGVTIGIASLSALASCLRRGPRRPGRG